MKLVFVTLVATKIKNNKKHLKINIPLQLRINPLNLKDFFIRQQKTQISKEKKN